MNKDKQFHQYGYDHYLKTPQRGQEREGYTESQGSSFARMRHNLMQNVSTPMGITIGLFVGALILSGVVFSSLSSSGDNVQDTNIPIIRANLDPVREQPIDRGGLDIPHQDSTILARVGQPSFQGSRDNVEDLLELKRQEKIADIAQKEEEIARAMASAAYGETYARSDSDQSSNSGSHAESFIPQNLLEPAAGEGVGTIPDFPQSSLESHAEASNAINQGNTPVDVLSIPPKTDESYVPLVLSDQDTVEKPFVIEEPQAPKTEDILQKVGAQRSDVDTKSDAFGVMTATAAVAQKPNFVATSQRSPQKMHPAASSPETIDFVRSVLNENPDSSARKVQERTSSQSLNNVNPAAGASRSSVTQAGTGGYFVQLASITDENRAPKEWNKMQSKYNMLQYIGYRTQKANLNNGTFYRIQAGPLPKSEADALCQALKKADKPGGCLVVRK